MESQPFFPLNLLLLILGSEHQLSFLPAPACHAAVKPPGFTRSLPSLPLSCGNDRGERRGVNKSERREERRGQKGEGMTEMRWGEMRGDDNDQWGEKEQMTGGRAEERGQRGEESLGWFEFSYWQLFVVSLGLLTGERKGERRRWQHWEGWLRACCLFYNLSFELFKIWNYTLQFASKNQIRRSKNKHIFSLTDHLMICRSMLNKHLFYIVIVLMEEQQNTPKMKNDQKTKF